MATKTFLSNSFGPRFKKQTPTCVWSPREENNAIEAKIKRFSKHVEAEIPIRLKSLSNEAEHWTTKSKRNRSQGFVVKYYLENQIYGLNLPCKIILTRIAPRTLDGDNLIIAFKKIRDTIAQLFFPETKPGQADSYECFTWEYSQEKGKPKEYWIRIRIEEI